MSTATPVREACRRTSTDSALGPARVPESRKRTTGRRLWGIIAAHADNASITTRETGTTHTGICDPTSASWPTDPRNAPASTPR